MKWSHLPVAGGLYDQHPDLLDQWWVIFGAMAKKEAEERRKQEFESGKANRKVAGGRRR
jgi:hypothetical protein